MHPLLSLPPSLLLKLLPQTLPLLPWYLIFSSVTMWRETLIPWFGNVKRLMCVLVLSMWSVSPNNSFQMLSSVLLSVYTKKEAERKWNLQLWEWSCFNLVVLFIIWIKIPLHFSIYSVTDYTSLHVPFVTTINTI